MNHVKKHPSFFTLCKKPVHPRLTKGVHYFNIDSLDIERIECSKCYNAIINSIENGDDIVVSLINID